MRQQRHQRQQSQRPWPEQHLKPRFVVLTYNNKVESKAIIAGQNSSEMMQKAIENNLNELLLHNTHDNENARGGSSRRCQLAKG